MTLEVVKQKSRGFICVNAHPEGCRVNVERQIDVTAAQPPAGATASDAPRISNVLVVGASTGYGLASRIAAGWGLRARTLGVFFERPPDRGRTASAGFYNTVAVHQRAKKDGLHAASLNGDAFSDEVKREAAEMIRKEFAPVDLVIYSLASPRRTDPRNGATYQSTLKPVGQAYSSRTIDLDSERVTEVTIEPASEQEVSDTVAVMGGEDWKRWIEMLLAENLLAAGARTLAYSYIGPQMTWPIYRDGTIGQAKKDLDRVAGELNGTLSNRLGGRAWVSVNKAIVTQASAAIPVVPLYMSILMKVMQEKGVEEGAIEQIDRLFREFLSGGGNTPMDAGGRIRLDDREMREEVQSRVSAVWPTVTTENLHQVSDFAGFKGQFRNLFGFEVPGVDYAQPTEIDLAW